MRFSVPSSLLYQMRPLLCGPSFYCWTAWIFRLYPSRYVSAELNSPQMFTWFCLCFGWVTHSPFSRRFVGREPLRHDTPVAQDDPQPHSCSAASPWMSGPCASLWLRGRVCYWLCVSDSRHININPTTFCMFLFTCNDEFQVKGVLAGSVGGNAGVDARITAGHRLNDQWVHTVFPHQHLVGRIRANGLSVQLPDEVRGGQTTHLCLVRTLNYTQCVHTHLQGFFFVIVVGEN